MRKCGKCGGGRLRRVHRTFLERFGYMAIYECRDCENEEFVPRPYTYHMGPTARCPKCGTLRLTKMRVLDKIDPMVSGPLNLLEKMLGGSLYHCVFCRLQFYDRRTAAPRTVLGSIPPTLEADGVPAGEIEAARSEVITTRPDSDIGQGTEEFDA